MQGFVDSLRLGLHATYPALAGTDLALRAYPVDLFLHLAIAVMRKKSDLLLFPKDQLTD
jgi:hypothetical protein